MLQRVIGGSSQYGRLTSMLGEGRSAATHPVAKGGPSLNQTPSLAIGAADEVFGMDRETGGAIQDPEGDIQ